MTSVWDSVLGQDRAVDHLQHSVVNPVHAYLLVGPEGCGKEEAARALAGVLLAGNDDVSDRNNDMALRGTHPDIHEVKREGASMLKDQAESHRLRPRKATAKQSSCMKCISCSHPPRRVC